MQSESASDTTQSDDSLQSDKLSGNESDSQVEVFKFNSICINIFVHQGNVGTRFEINHSLFHQQNICV